MSGLGPAWAMSGQAIDGRGDTHLAAANHLRIVTNPLLGLPVCPIVVHRVTTAQKSLLRYTRSDATWVDSTGAVLTPPFTVTPRNPVTAYLPAAACWAQVAAEPSRVDLSQPPVRGPVLGPVRGPVLKPGGLTTPIRGPVIAPILRSGTVRVTAMVTTPLGDAPVAVRSRAPYQVYASHIERVVVSGSGTVSGIRWLDPRRSPGGKPWWSLPLPCGPGARYAGPGDGWDRGLERAQNAAPTRLGMHEQPLAAGPAACDPVGPGDEWARVEQLGAALTDELDRLVNDTSASQMDLVDTSPVSGVGGTGVPTTSDRNLLSTLLQATLDPGVARWLPFGVADLDEAEEGTTAIYLVSAAFAPSWEAIDKLGLRGSLPAPEDPREVIARLAKLADDGWDGGWEVGEAVQLDMVLVAPVGVPLDLPAAPPTTVSWDGSWQSVPPPAASRRLVADLDSLTPGAALASAIAQPGGATPSSRHLKDGIGRLLLMGPSQPPTATRATQGRLTDRGVGEADGVWQIAQADWFGRWSGWTQTPFGAGQRPRPPRPVVMLTTTPPFVPTPAPTGPLSGTVRIEVPIPATSTLPPGARALAQLELTVVPEGGGATVALHPIPAGTSVIVSVPGPALLPTASGQVTVTARWLDTAGIASEPSEPRRAILHDPRAPAPVVLPATLTYTARPDVTGWAQTTLSWPHQPGQASFRVFVADETTLRAKLAEITVGTLGEGDAGQAPSAGQAQTLLDALDAAAGAPERAAAWATHKGMLPRRWFMQLTADPLPASTTSPTTTFRHQISGALTVLTLYRVVAVSAASVESDFRTSPMLPRAVPNVLAPTTPSIRVVPVTTEADELQATITVTVPVGPAPAAFWRLRRASATTVPAMMMVVAEGPVPASTGSGEQVFEIVDTGSTPAQPRTSLTAWVQYSWRVEVRGADLPGGGPPGEWSAPSAPASTRVMPAGPPVGVTGLTTTRDGTGVHVVFTYPGRTEPGASPGYVVDVYRQRPGESMRIVTSVPGLAAGPGGAFDVLDADPAVPAGTGYRVVVTDPIGRSAPPSEEVRLA